MPGSYIRADQTAEHQVEQKKELRDGYSTTKSYLEIKEGKFKQFRIAIRFHKPAIRNKAYHIQVYIDGRDFHANAFLNSGEDESDTFYRSDVHSMVGGQAMSGALHFARLELTSDEEEAEIQGAAINELCSLVVQIQEGTTRLCYDCVTEIPRDTALKVGKVHESKMKLGVTVSGQDFQPMSTPTSCVHFHADPRTPKVCAFVWKYYTRDMLILKDIIKADPVPVPGQAVARPASRIRAERRARRAFEQRHGLPHIPEEDERLVPGGSGRKKRLHPMDYYDDEKSEASDEDEDTLITPKKAKIIEMIDLTGDDEGGEAAQGSGKREVIVIEDEAEGTGGE